MNKNLKLSAIVLFSTCVALAFSVPSLVLLVTHSLSVFFKTYILWHVSVMGYETYIIYTTARKQNQDDQNTIDETPNTHNESGQVH